MPRFYVRLALLILGGFAATAARPAVATQFWMAETDPVVQRDGQRFVPADYMQLFAPNAPWQKAESRLSVFKVSTQFILRGEDADIRTVFDAMHRRHIAMAVEIGTVTSLGGCGGGEGYNGPGAMDRVGGRLQKLGLTLDYMAMDEPVWLAHERTWGRTRAGLPDCHYPVDMVARSAAQNVLAMRRYFPSIQVGDIEVVATRLDPRMVFADYAEFAQLFQRYAGFRLAFMHADTAWQYPWQPIMPALARSMHALGIRFGVIIGGSQEDGSDEAWVADGLQRLRQLADDPATRPDDVIVQSWQPLPTRVLPETAPGTDTFMLLQAEDMMR